ncbi:hypothetical protein [Serratia grimesii]|nr:hypothetical protein [Serratia grimesii]
MSEHIYNKAKENLIVIEPGEMVLTFGEASAVKAHRGMLDYTGSAGNDQ